MVAPLKMSERCMLSGGPEVGVEEARRADITVVYVSVCVRKKAMENIRDASVRTENKDNSEQVSAIDAKREKEREK